MLVWYPTQTAETPWQIGPFQIPATRDAGVAPGRFPVVLLSHGGGRTGGSPLLLRELCASLAHQGFIVVAPFHGKTRLAARTVQISAALDTVLADPRFSSRIASEKLGMIGFSLGGAVTLANAGATPNPGRLTAYCAAHPEDSMSCHSGPGGSGQDNQPRTALSSIPHLPLKGIVLLDPFGVLFDSHDLAPVKLPVLMFRPDSSQLGEQNTLTIAEGLTQKPKIHQVPGSHFIFTDICPPLLKEEAPAVCIDADGIDRLAVHGDIERRVAAFFHEVL